MGWTLREALKSLCLVFKRAKNRNYQLRKHSLSAVMFEVRELSGHYQVIARGDRCMHLAECDTARRNHVTCKALWLHGASTAAPLRNARHCIQSWCLVRLTLHTELVPRK